MMRTSANVSQRDSAGHLVEVPTLDLSVGDKSAMPLAVKVAIIVTALNLLVAAMILVKLRAPHLG